MRRKETRLSCCTAWRLSALLTLPKRASSFSWPQSKPRRLLPPVSSSRTSRIRRERNANLFYRFPADRNVNGTTAYWLEDSLQRTATRTVPLAQEQDASSHDLFSSVPTSNSESATVLEQELFEGYIAHQSLLNPQSDEAGLERYESILSIPSEDLNFDDFEDIISVTTTTAAANTSTTATAKQSSIFPVLSDAWRARLLLLLSAALYGTNFALVKSLDESMSVGLSSTLRFGFAAAAMLPWLLAPADEGLKPSVRQKMNDTYKSKGSNVLQKLVAKPVVGATLAGMEIGMYNSIGYIVQAVGLKTTTASKSAFICSMAVVTVPILDKLWGKPLLKRQILGAALAAVGVYALELGGTETTLTDGDLLSLVQPLMFGLGFWRMEAAMERYPTEAGRLAAAQILMVFLMSFSYLVCWSPPIGDDVALLSDACSVLPTASEVLGWLHDPYILGVLFWTGVVTTAFTVYMETVALRTLSAAEATLIFSTEPLFGTAFAAAVAGECLGPEAAVGAAFIIGGCIVSGMDVGRFLRGERVTAAEATGEDILLSDES